MEDQSDKDGWKTREDVKSVETKRENAALQPDSERRV
jgi:hypothetical protein